MATEGVTLQAVAHQTIQPFKSLALLHCSAKAQLCAVHRYADSYRHGFLIFSFYLLGKEHGLGSTPHNVAFLGSRSVAQREDLHEHF